MTADDRQQMRVVSTLGMLALGACSPKQVVTALVQTAGTGARPAAPVAEVEAPK